MPDVQVESLLKKISPDYPSGEFDLEHDRVFMEFEEEIQGTPAVEYQGKIVKEAKDPNWSKCEETALELLGRTHDLRVAVPLTRVLLHTAGLDGFHDGLRLICGFVEGYWDTVYPQLDPDDNDPFERVNILEMLTDWSTTIAPLMKVDLCRSRSMGNVNLRHYRIATGKASELSLTDEEVKSAPNLAAIEGAFTDCNLEELQATFHGANGALAEAKRLQSLMNETVGSDQAPDLKELIQVLGEIDSLLNAQLSRRLGKSAQAAKEPEKARKAEKPVTSVYERPKASDDIRSFEMVESRQEVIELLDKICAYYEVFEPASPVPLLLKRAMRLVTMNFMEIIEDLAPEGLPKVVMLCGPKEP